MSINKIVSSIKQKTEDNDHIGAMLQACELLNASTVRIIREKLICIHRIQELDGFLDSNISHYRMGVYYDLKDCLKAELNENDFLKVHSSF